MPNSRELQKHLEGVKLTFQIAGAMKTASTVKFAKTGAALSAASPRTAACREIRNRFGGALSAAEPCVNPSAPKCFIILGTNRGLCGGYNHSLYEFADDVLAKAGSCRLIVVGRHAAARYRGISVRNGDHILTDDSVFVIPDVPKWSDAAPVFDLAVSLYRAGEVSSVGIIGQKFVNALVQKPYVRQLLPIVPDIDADETGHTDSHDVIFMPDRETVLMSAASAVISAEFYSYILEAAAGAQAASLAAMRAASDSAEKTAAKLESDISRLRQSEITSGVIEVAGGNAGRKEIE